jgi:hypothetical protein
LRQSNGTLSPRRVRIRHTREAAMKMEEIKTKAKTMHIRVGRMKKAELIRAIQLQEGNTPCYQTEQPLCSQESCLWRDDCLGR